VPVHHDKRRHTNKTHILTVGTGLRYVVSVRFQPLTSHGKFSRYPLGGWVGCRVGLDIMARGSIGIRY
jgi:hypothetical protein